MTFLRLPTPDAASEDQYSMPDPDALADAYERLYRAVWYERSEPDLKDIKAVLELASGYLDLTMYPPGREVCVGKLRDIWRARRARG